jgi:GWxTD domain-containing protein
MPSKKGIIVRLTVSILWILIAGVLFVYTTPTAEQNVLDEREIQFYLKNMHPELRREVEAFRCVLTPAEQHEFFTLPYDHLRRRWIDDYWKMRDPVYTTPENEVLQEHKQRVAIAESMFFKSSWPMWDQRGEVYIRFGPPSFRQFIPAEVERTGTSPPGEMWYYHQHDMYVLFEDSYSSGEYSYYMEKVKGPRGPGSDKTAGAIDGPLMVVGPGIVPPAPPSISYLSPFDQYQKRIGKFMEMKKTTPATFWHMFEQNRLPLVFSVDCFRGGEWMDRVDVNLEFEADLIAGYEKRKTSKYIATAVFWDIERKEVGRDEQTLEIPVADEVMDSTRHVPAQLTFTLSPGFYHMAVTMREEHSARVASYRTEVTCEDFESKLAVSDILFASFIRQTRRDSPFNRGALEVVPHPARRYRMGDSVPLYFEIYNMTVSGQSVASYTVEYRIVPLGPAKSGWLDFAKGDNDPVDITSSFRASCNGPNDVVHIKLESDNLWEGVFDFHVKIIDELSHAEVEREASFTIIE